MRILGIELGAWSLKAVEMESRFRRLEILDLHEIRLPLEPADPVACYKEAVHTLLGRLPSHPEKLVTSLPASQTALRFLDLPVKQRKKVEQMYRFELEDTLPINLDEAIVEHAVMRTKSGNQVFAAIALKKHIQSHLDWLNSIDLDPDWLTFEGMGLINYYLSGYSEEKEKEEETEDKPLLLMDIGHLKSNFAFIYQGRLEFFRSVPWGGHSITQAIAGALNLTSEEAEEAKIRDLNLDISDESTDSHAFDVVAAASRAIIPLITDAQHSMVTYRNQKKHDVAEIIITGGTARAKGIEKFIQKHLRKPVIRFNGMEGKRFGKTLSGNQALSFAESIGRAVVFARKAHFLFNFRKAELAKKTSLTEFSTSLKDPKVLRFVKYSGVFAAIFLAYVLVATPIAERSAKQANKNISQAFKQTFSEVDKKRAKRLIGDPEQLKRFISKELKKIDQRIALMKNQRTPILKLLTAVSNSFPEDLRVDVNKIDLTDRTFFIEGVVYKGGDLAKVTQSLRDSDFFDKIVLNQNGQRFTYRGEVIGR